MLEFIPTNANNCRLQSITSERIIPELKAAIKCVHEYKYDTQLLIEGKDLDVDVISDYFTENFKGGCLLAVGDEELIKIHFHTNEPWKVLEYCASLGEIHDIVVEDMDRQARGLKG